MKKIVIAFGVLTSLAAALGIRAFQHPAQPDQLSKLQKGMTKEQVREILGPPSNVHTSGQWTYSKPLVFGFVNIRWRTDGLYDGDYNYERF